LLDAKQLGLFAGGLQLLALAEIGGEMTEVSRPPE